MGTDLTFKQLQDGLVGEVDETGGGDFLTKINNIITGINALFANYERLRGNVNTRGGGPDHPRVEDSGPNRSSMINEKDVLKVVDQRLFQLVTTTFQNKFFNVKLSDLINDYGDQTVTQLMESFAKEGQPG
jgi:hypothetical protein